MKEKRLARRFFDATFGSPVSGMDLRWWDLRFQGECEHLEEPFARTYVENSIGHVRFASVMGLVLFMVFGWLDAMLLPDHTSQIWIIRFGVLCPMVFLVFAMTYAKWFPRVMQPVLAGVVMFSGFCISAMIAIAPEPANYSYYAGNILVIIFGYAFFRLRFVWATFAGWIVVASYQVAAMGFSDTPSAVLINNNFFFLSANAIGMFASYCIEQYARRDFFMAAELDRERKALESYRDELEVRVEERTRDALAAARSKSEFLANMSHEIRTPMNGVLGMLDLLRGTELDQAQQDNVDTAFRSAEGLLGILNDVLDLSKIEAGKMTLDPEPVAPGLVVEEVCALLNQQAAGKGLMLLPMLDADAYADFYLDSVRLRQILLNLVGNAIKFTERGYVHVHCALEGEVLEFVVEDTGIGISAEQQSRLFEAFAQADGSTTRRFGGTGLGLTITRELVELMQGQVAVDSAPGVGSRFCVSIPARQADGSSLPLLETPVRVALQLSEHFVAAALGGMLRALRCRLVDAGEADVVITDMDEPASGAQRSVRYGRQADEGVALAPPLRLAQLAQVLEPRSTPQRQAVPASGDLAGLRVLLVEDNPVNRRVAGAMLKRGGVEWVAASNGQEAVRMFGEESFDLVLMDCQMPGMDGFQATRAIRARETADGRQQTPIIALTANAMEGDRDACLSAGMNDYLAKPVNIADLHERLRWWTLQASAEVSPPH